MAPSPYDTSYQDHRGMLPDIVGHTSLPQAGNGDVSMTAGQVSERVQHQENPQASFSRETSSRERWDMYPGVLEHVPVSQTETESIPMSARQNSGLDQENPSAVWSQSRQPYTNASDIVPINFERRKKFKASIIESSENEPFAELIECKAQLEAQQIKLNEQGVQLAEQQRLLSQASEEILRLKEGHFNTGPGNLEQALLRLKAKTISLGEEAKGLAAARDHLQDPSYQPSIFLNQELGELLASTGIEPRELIIKAEELLEKESAKEIYRLQKALSSEKVKKQTEIDRLRSHVQRQKRDLDQAYEEIASLRPLLAERNNLEVELKDWKAAVGVKSVLEAAKLGQLYHEVQEIFGCVSETEMNIQPITEAYAENEKAQLEINELKKEIKRLQRKIDKHKEVARWIQNLHFGDKIDHQSCNDTLGPT